MRTKEVTYEDNIKYKGTSELILEEIIDLFDSMVWSKNAFMYFPINDVNLCQISGEKANRFLLEITNDSDDMVFHQCYVDKDECRIFIKTFFNTDELTPELLLGFYEVAIASQTLDEVMNPSLKRKSFWSKLIGK